MLLMESDNAFSSFHLWQIRELYSNTSGTVQFIELTALAGGQQFIGGRTVTSAQAGLTRSFMFPTDLPGDTATVIGDDGGYGGCGAYGTMCVTTYKSFLIGTQGFAALNVVQPDYVVPNGFLFTTNGSVNFAGVDSISYASLPLDGRMSLKRDGTTSANSPTNFVGLSSSLVPTSLSVGVSQITPVAGTKITFSALTSARTSSSTATFRENGVALAGCNSIPILALPGTVSAGVATCNVNAITTGNHTYVVSHAPGAESSAEQSSVSVNALAAGPLDYTDMWWAGKAEDGWGMSITQHGIIQFIVIYAYDNVGKPLWYVIPGGSWNAAQTAFTGNVYLPTSSPLNAYDKAQFRINASVGSATVTYTGIGTASLAYTINGVSGVKSIQRQLFATDDGQPRLQVYDLWWAGSQEDGWGMNIAQQGRVLFPVWYTYDASGKAVFFAVPGGTWNGSTFTGDIYSTVASPWLGAPYDPSLFRANLVGSMTLSFVDQSNAVMRYTVNGFTQTKNIFRQPY